jgi:hypothetical protein
VSHFVFSEVKAALFAAVQDEAARGTGLDPRLAKLFEQTDLVSSLDAVLAALYPASPT